MATPAKTLAMGEDEARSDSRAEVDAPFGHALVLQVQRQVGDERQALVVGADQAGERVLAHHARGDVRVVRLELGRQVHAVGPEGDGCDILAHRRACIGRAPRCYAKNSCCRSTGKRESLI